MRNQLFQHMTALNFSRLFSALMSKTNHTAAEQTLAARLMEEVKPKID